MDYFVFWTFWDRYFSYWLVDTFLLDGLRFPPIWKIVICKKKQQPFEKKLARNVYFITEKNFTLPIFPILYKYN